ncbi:hypothetical protein [Burkholderia sp. 3C]
MVRITVQTPVGDLSTGTAFHIGDDGWLVTVAHVLRDGVVREVVAYTADRLDPRPLPGWQCTGPIPADIAFWYVSEIDAISSQ